MCSEAVLAEMGVALKDDSSLVGVFSPKKVSITRPSRLRLVALQHAASSHGGGRWQGCVLGVVPRRR